MDINFICTRKRKEFGKPCAFVDVSPTFVSEIDPNPLQRDEFVILSTADRTIDNSTRMCAHEVNTVSHPTESRGMNHMEGGWPAKIDSIDEDSTARFRKNVEKDKVYVNTVRSLSDFLENFIMENNSIDIYEEYFEGERIKRSSDYSVRNISIFPDIEASYRSVTDLCWTTDSSKLAAVYSLKQTNVYPKNPCSNSYVWDIENCNCPVSVLKPDSFLTCVQFSPANSNLIASGYISGQVAVWDIRVSGHAQQLSNILSNNVGKINGVRWLVGKHDMAFFSGSSDGKLISWDARNLSLPTQVIHLHSEKSDIPNLDKNYTISCAEYDQTQPNKFMVGTEQGVILNFNRKYKEKENMLNLQYKCSSGPLLTVERNAFFPQLFVSCDAWTIKLWSEDITDTPILNVLSRDGFFTDIAWSSTRASTMYATKTTGILEVWDFPGKNKDALLSIKLENDPLLSVSIAESGNHVACGTSSGNIELLNIPEYLRTSSELEMELVKNCVRETEEIIGGKARSEQKLGKESEFVTKVTDEEWWDPPDKAEDLYEEYKELFKDFITEDD